MLDPGLAALYRLHKLDSQLFEIKGRAASLDAGHKEAAALKSFDAETADQRARAHKMQADLKAAELEQQGRLDKIKKFQSQLYDGSLTNAREVENVQKEIEMLNAQSVSADDRILALMEMLPRQLEEAQAAEKKLAALRAEAVKKHDAAKVIHAKLQEEFKAAGAGRKAIADEVPPALLREYDHVRAKTGSTGLALVSMEFRCSSCGMHTPEKVLDLLRSGKLMQCEGCRRILLLAE